MRSIPLLLAKVLGGAALVTVIFLLMGWLVSPDIDRPSRIVEAAETYAIEVGRDVSFDARNPPTVQREVDYAEGEAAAWWPKGEPDYVAELVAEGRLPPVAERTGPEPLVLAGCDGIGRYGGSWLRVASSDNDVGVITWRLSTATPVRWSPMGYPVRPHLVKAVDRNGDGTVYTIRMRRGMRWSDGHPVTADDVMYFWEDECVRGKYYPKEFQVAGRIAEVEKVDDFTVRVTFPIPNGVFLEDLCRAFVWCQPEHYLRQFHPDLGDDEVIAKAMAERGAASPRALYGQLKHWNNPDIPRLWPWVLRTGTTTPPFTFVRNPYFCAVDEAGNQLPYLDQVIFTVKGSANMIPVAATNGEMSMQLRHLNFADYTLLMNGRQEGGYQVYHWLSATRSPVTVFPNINRAVEKIETLSVPLWEKAKKPLAEAVGFPLAKVPKGVAVEEEVLVDEAVITACAAAKKPVEVLEVWIPVDGCAAQGFELHQGVVKDDGTVIGLKGTEVTPELVAAARQALTKNLLVVTSRTPMPEWAKKRALLNERDFRIALSLAIDRDEIIRAEFNGLTEPAQVDPGKDSPCHSEKLYHAFTAHDPERAKELLDGLGLKDVDGDGYREFADGSRMDFDLNVTSEYLTNAGPCELMVDHWARVGVRVTLKDMARTIFYAKKNAYQHDFTVWTSESEFYPVMEPRSFVPVNSESTYAPGFGIWYQSGGTQNDPRALRAAGAIEPPEDHPLRRAMEAWDRVQSTPDLGARNALIKSILDEYCAPYCWTISICTPPPQVVVVKDGLRNVPKNGLVAAAANTPSNTGMETYYWESPEAPHAIIDATTRARLKAEMVETYPAGSGGSSGGGSGLVGKIILGLILVSLVGGLLLLAFRHPFVARRLLIMVPTLFVISIIVFTIVQLPEGNFLDNKIQELQMKGEEGAIKQVEDLKSTFRPKDPAVVKYCRWMGFSWFAGFDPKDQGLLQGHLGWSMEANKAVNDLIGDRITLTFLITLGTILFTWTVAFAIGTYSAVRQYSLGDYGFTLLGFIGMSVPNFLLALVLMYWAQTWFGVTVTGLFSPEYATRGWSWGKFVDLLKHLWLPVVVIGVGGTAGMIRVMRGNLLDELKKPYVTTARAKGVRPLKLLFKYPVRLALNPFISGIGGIFPALVSGGAIVAMVLSLPTVGPKLLTAVMTEDTYVAGSMLMILSLLGVCGTLVSDLLLLWLDPRIRFEGKAAK